MDIFALPKWLASRARKEPCTTVVLHATAGSSMSGAIQTLIFRGLSYHYLIAKDGAVTKAVPYSRVAFHAGKSFGPGGDNVNRYSIGISFVNRNDGKDPYTREQVDACKALIATLQAAVPTLKWLTTHYAISPGRKTDPKAFSVKSVQGSLRLWGQLVL